MMECAMNKHSQETSQSNDEIVVFMVRRESTCAECGADLQGRLLRKEKDRGVCMDCADLGHLEFLRRGDAAVTRRASKYSSLRAVVVQWSRSRKRYERQGILVEPQAIERAEQESLADADLRARRQERAAVKRADEDGQFIEDFTDAIRTQYPSCPANEAKAIANHACRKHSGRVGRSAAAQQFDPEAVTLAVVAHVRHVHTKYDRLLMQYDDRQLARGMVSNDVQRVLDRWRGHD
jgi:hypothetical protein